jgi:hypothetical protein
MGYANEFVNIYLMNAVITCKGIVKAQGTILEIVFEALGLN